MFCIVLAYSYLCKQIMNEQRPLVSFILTYYNLPVPMLCECIDSILALSLTPQEREIIVIDDGSDTSPMNGLMHYGDDIIYVRQKQNGVSVARNTGMNMAKGEYIQIVDGDDCLLKAPYEFCLSIIRQHQDTEIVLFDFTHHNDAEQNIFKEPMLTDGAQYMRNNNLRGAACCCLFRQSVKGNLAFTPGIAYAEDEEFTPQLLLRAEVVYVTQAQAYYYRQRRTSAVHQRDDKRISKRLNDTRDIILNLHKIEDRLPQNDRLAMQRRIAQLTMDYIYNIITLTQSGESLNSRLQELRNVGLFPLPNQDYSKKYTWFRRMSNTLVGRQILLHTLPYLKRER